MKLLNREDLKALLERDRGPCVSMFMPTHRAAGREVQQDPIRLKNLLREAEDELQQLEVRSTEAKNMLAPAAEMLDDELFWEHQGDGLAIFLSDGFFQYYQLPLELEELVVATARFHIKPLIPFLTDNGRFYVLALSQNDVRLLECTRYTEQEIDLTGSDVPTDIATALRYDDPEKQHQYHTGAPAPGARGAGSRGRWVATFHGQGVVDEVKDDLRRYFEMIDRGLRGLLGNDSTPLVLAGVNYLLPIYAEVNTYPNLVETGVTGNPDGLSLEELRERAWDAAGSMFFKARNETVGEYFQQASAGLGSQALEEVVAAAFYGRVDTLFVATGAQVWGTVNTEGGTVEIHQEAQPGDEDLLDFAAAHTLMNSGTVFAVEPEDVPGGGPVSAIFRY
jgi:hypothetical protein